MLMKNFNSFFNQLTAMPKRLAMVLTLLFTLGVGSIWGETATHIWDLTSSSASWTSSGCETYFTQPYGMKKVNAYIINKSIEDFENYAATATSIQIGVKSLCNGATTSKLTIYLVDKDGNAIGSGQEITPDNKSAAANTTYKYVTFTSNLTNATGYKIQCTTFGKNVLVNGSSYEITHEDSSSGGSGDGGSSSGEGTINFGTNNVKINSSSVTGQDDLGNSWTITTVATESSFTQQPTYSQVGSSSKPATSITFTTTLPKEVTITKFSAKFGGFSNTAGNVTLKVGDTSVGTGKLNATSDVTVTNTTEATGKVLTVTVTNIAKGVKVYYISYTYTTSSGEPTQLLAPTGLKVSNITSSSATLSWTKDSNAKSYTINILGENDSEAEPVRVIEDITTTPYTLTGLEAETEYLIGLVAVGDGTTYTDSKQSLFDVFETLAACTDEVTISKGAQNNGSFKLDKVGAQSTCNGAVVITLSEITPVSGYKFSEITQTGVDANKVTINNNNKTITYTKNATGNSEINVNFIAIQKLENPNNLNYSNISCSGVTLAWNKVDGATNYQLIRTNKSTSASTTTTVNQQDNPSVYCTLSAGSSWSWSVQAIGDGTSYLNSDLTIGDDFTLPYTITYNTNGGTFIAQDCGTTLPAELPTPTRNHYNFAGWYMDEGFNTPAEAGSVINTNTTLYAKWEEIKFTITWSINGNTTNSQELQEGTTITPPADLDAATYACEDKVFVGWVDASIDGNTNEEPDFITDFGNVKEIKTYYAVFATPSGDGFTLGQSGDFTIYANLGNGILYATNLDNGKLGSTAQINDAVTFVFTHKGNNQYTISNGSKYLALKAYNSTDLQTQNDEYLWTIASATDGKGSWRVTSVNTPSRAIIYRSGYDFKAYGTNNINTNGYYDIEIGGATTYTEYVTSCVTCENVLTISKGNEENGTFTLDKVGEQETCDGLSVLVTPTPAEHYHVASVSASTGENVVNNGDGTYTITYAANSTGESTINVVFEEDTKYTVTWMVNGLPYIIGAPSTTVYADERVATLPTPPEPNAYCGDVFVGWTTENPASGNFNEAPTVYNEQSAFPPATGNQTFYAVFADYEN